MQISLDRLSIKLNLLERRVNIIDAKILSLAASTGKATNRAGELVDTNFPEIHRTGIPDNPKPDPTSRSSPFRRDKKSARRCRRRWRRRRRLYHRVRPERSGKGWKEGDQNKPEELGIRVTSCDRKTMGEGDESGVTNKFIARGVTTEINKFIEAEA